MNDVRPKLVMIIEDDQDISDSVLDLLESEGYSVLRANNGQEGLDLLNEIETLPKLIILDLMMPVMSGFVFRERQELNSRIANIPVVLLTADPNIEVKRLKIGAKSFLRKPIEISDFLSTVKDYFQ